MAEKNVVGTFEMSRPYPGNGACNEKACCVIKCAIQFTHSSSWIFARVKAPTTLCNCLSWFWSKWTFGVKVVGLLVVHRGKCATVRRCRERSSGRQWAAKFLRKRRRAQELRAEALHEVAVLDAAAHCSRLVSLHQVFETNTEMVLVLEL